MTDEKETLYIHNLNEKIKIDDMRNSLNNLFSKYGQILQIKIHNNIRLKGQAFISFESLEDAIKAKNELNNTNFLDKILYVDYAKENSDKVLLLKSKLTDEEKQEKDLQRKRKRDQYYIDFFNKLKNENKKLKESESIVLPKNANHVLFIEGLSKDADENKLRDLFKNGLNGFVEIRFFLNKGICFVEYENDIYATEAMNKLNKYKLDKSVLNIAYAKK